MPRTISILAALFLIPAGFASSQALETQNWMDAESLNTTFKDKALEGEYASGRSFKETYRGDGGLRYQDDMRESGGHWSVSQGTFCTIYDDDPAGGCFRVQQIGANCFEFYFVARTEEKAPGPPDREPSWTARAWIADHESTCKVRIGA